jgi:hypothetical protein
VLGGFGRVRDRLRQGQALCSVLTASMLVNMG